MDLVVVDVLELVRASNDGGSAVLSSPFAPVPLSFVSSPRRHRCPSSPSVLPGPGHECHSESFLLLQASV